MDPNYDPRDEHEMRPQVGFRLRVGAYDSRQLFSEFGSLGLVYYDLMLFDPADGEVPGVVRFHWDAREGIVDAAARWFEGLPYVVKVFPSYGGPIEGAR